VQTLNRDNFKLIVRERIAWEVEGLSAKKDEKVLVWIAKLSFGDLQRIISIDVEDKDETADEARERRWKDTCGSVQRHTFSGDTSAPLFETAQELIDNGQWDAVQSLANAIMQANGIYSDPKEIEEQEGVVKNV
jgi:hypothetical protein